MITANKIERYLERHRYLMTDDLELLKLLDSMESLTRCDRLVNPPTQGFNDGYSYVLAKHVNRYGGLK